MEGQFDGPPRRQKLVALYGEKFPRSDPKTEFFNTISRSCPGSAVYHNEVGLGNGYLRRLLVVGATSVTRRAPTTDTQTGAWVRSLLERKPTRLVTVAIANKTARTAWALLAKGESYKATPAI